MYIIGIGKSMISSDNIWHKYHEWYFTTGIYAKYHVQITLLFVNTTTRKKL